MPLQSARVGFVTTSGAHLVDQAPFDIMAPAGDSSVRAFPSSTPLGEIQLSHRGYNSRRASVDKNVVLPLDHLRAAVADGVSAIVKPSRAMFVAHPFGLTFGPIGAAATQRAVVDALLSIAVNMDAPGIRDVGFTWTEDDFRARHLRKQAH